MQTLMLGDPVKGVNFEKKPHMTINKEGYSIFIENIV